MGQPRSWPSAGHQEDWLREKGKLLGVLADTLADSLRMDFPPVPSHCQLPVFGYITPVAADFVRRRIWMDDSLTAYLRVQLHINMLRTYGFLASYGGDKSDKGRFIDQILSAP